jgi:phage terminase small subunit
MCRWTRGPALVCGYCQYSRAEVAKVARPGRKPTPTALKVARGNPGKRPLNTEEPQLPAADLTPPAGLEGRALQEWQTMGPIWTASGVLTAGDLKCFEVYCKCVDDEERWTEACRKIGDAAAFQTHYAAHLVKIRDQLKRYLELLGGTPSSRSGIKAKKPVDPADERRRRFFGIKGGAPPEGTA